MKKHWFQVHDSHNHPTTIFICTPCKQCTALWLAAEWETLEFTLESTSFTYSSSGDEVGLVTCIDTTLNEKSSFPYLPHPSCGRHSQQTRKIDFQWLFTDSLLNPIHDLYQKPSTIGGLSVWVAISRVFIANKIQIIVGRGIDFDPEKARLKAVMEALERFSLYHQPSAKLVWTSTQNSFISPLVVPTDSKNRWWIETLDIRDGSSNQIPLEFCQLTSQCTVNSSLGIGSSTGCAAHFSLPEAIETGFFENIERLILQKFRDGHYQLVRITSKTLPSHIQEIQENIKSNCYSINIFMGSPYAGIHFATAILLPTENNSSHTILGAKISNNAISSITGAIFEACGELINLTEFKTSDKNYESLHSSCVAGILQPDERWQNRSINAPEQSLSEYCSISEGNLHQLTDIPKCVFLDRTPNFVEMFGVRVIQSLMLENFSCTKNQDYSFRLNNIRST